MEQLFDTQSGFSNLNNTMCYYKKKKNTKGCVNIKKHPQLYHM